jgi:acetate kinase
VGCFDTAFHHGHPRVADVYALPARWREAGVRRYGFHGLSYEFVMGELLRIDPRCGAGRVAIAHLGNGASLCALQGGRSIDSTMGFSVLDGLPMGTRCGQLDPGAVLYLQQTHGLDAEAVADLLYHRSGLLGLSGLSHDMRVLERAAAAGHEGARLAIDCYVYRVRREIGAAAAALGGLDALVFTGGIGENAAPLRARVCESLDWLGLAFDASANASAALRAGAAHRLSTAASRVAAYVIPTDEELLIARACAAMLRT